jgi:kynurenine formamidase
MPPRLEGCALKVIDISRELTLEDFIRSIHASTHIESPAQLLRDGRSLDLYDPEVFVTQAVLLDLAHVKAAQAIDDEDLEAAEERAGLSIREGEAVLLRTGRGVAISNASSSQNHPYLSENGAEFLEFKHPTIVGTDAPSLDLLGGGELPAHSVLLHAGILLLEGLCDLDRIEQPRFQLIALPLRLKSSASPVRAVVVVES